MYFIRFADRNTVVSADAIANGVKLVGVTLGPMDSVTFGL